MDKIKKSVTTGIILFGVLFLTPVVALHSAPPVQSQESKQQEEGKKKEEEKNKTPEDEKKAKEEAEYKKNLGQLRGRQQTDENSTRVRNNIFPASTPETDCTGADKARSRLDDVSEDGGIVIKGNLNINSKNEANVGKNEGSISSNTNINITNNNNKKC
jgi:hypothetical protein